MWATSDCCGGGGMSDMWLQSESEIQRETVLLKFPMMVVYLGYFIISQKKQKKYQEMKHS